MADQLSNIMNKVWEKIVAVIVIVIFIAVFKSTIIDDPNIYESFRELMGVLPFSEKISEIVCKVMGYSSTIPPVISKASFMTDVFKLPIMSCIQPLCVALLTKIFLPMPAASSTDFFIGRKKYESREKYMDSAGYRIKELLITVCTAPVFAYVAAILSDKLFNWLDTKTAGWVTIVVGVVISVISIGLSMIPLLILKVAVGVALAWQLVITLGYKILTTMITNALCIVLYIAIISKNDSKIFGSVVTLIVWLVLSDLLLQFLRRFIVRVGAH